MVESWIWLKFRHPTLNCNICSSFTHRTSQLCLIRSQEPCEWVDADLRVLWVNSEQILHLKAGCPNFGPVRGSAIYPIYAEHHTNSESWGPILGCVDFEFGIRLPFICVEMGSLGSWNTSKNNGHFYEKLSFEFLPPKMVHRGPKGIT